MINIKKTKKFNNNIKFLIIFGSFLIVAIIAIIYNFVFNENIQKINNFEYWAIFFFAVFLLITWKFHSYKSNFKFFFKFFLTFFIMSLFIILLTLPVCNIYIGGVKNVQKIYNGIGIFIFMCAWIIEMYLFWNSEKNKNTDQKEIVKK